MAQGDAIDRDLLPRRALVDSGVAGRAFWPGDFLDEDQDRIEHSELFVRGMIAAGNTILIATITLAELFRFSPARSTPHARGIEIVAFDEPSSRVFTKDLREELLKDTQNETGGRRPVVRHDALIVATAARYNAECIVSLDEKAIVRLADRVGLPVRLPSEYLQRQTMIPGTG